MKVKVKLSENVIVEADGANTLEVFEQLAQLTEIFGEQYCGKCEGKNNKGLKYVLRKSSDKSKKKEYKYFELHCQDFECRAKLHFGQSEDFVFPKRYEIDDEGNKVKDDNDRNIVAGKWGWVIYNKETGKEE